MRSERRRQSVFETHFKRDTPSRPSRPGVHERSAQIYIDYDFPGEAEYDIHGDEDPERLEESSVLCRLCTYSNYLTRRFNLHFLLRDICIFAANLTPDNHLLKDRCSNTNNDPRRMCTERTIAADPKAISSFPTWRV